MKRFLEKYLTIYVHEAAPCLWISAIFFVIFFVIAIFRIYVDTTFLKRFGPQYIPWMLLINAVLTFVVFSVADRLARRFRDHSLLVGILLIYAGATAALFLTIKEGVKVGGFEIAYPILYQLLHLLDSVMLVYLWNIAGDLFDARQGKRIFPFITALQVLGTTLGSFFMMFLTRMIGDDPTLLVFGAVCFATALFTLKTAGPYMEKSGPKGTARQAVAIRLREVPGLMAKYPIVRYLIITGIIPNFLLPIFLYQFGVIANDSFASEQTLAGFLSIFTGLTTFSTFVILLFVGRLYQWIGLSSSSLVQPANFAFLFGGLTAFFNIYLACYGRFSVILIQRAIAGPVNKILFSIIPSELQLWSRTFIRGTVLKVGMLAGAVSMIVLKPVVSARYLSVLALAAAAYWLLETLFFRKHYTRVLKQVIVEKQIDFDQIELMRSLDSGGGAMELGPVSVEDRTVLPEVVSARESPRIEPEVALRLLDDSNPQTRAEAAASFIYSHDMRAVGKLIRCLEDGDDEVRKAAIEALMGYRETILPFLEITLIEAPPRAKQGILEVIRLSGLKEFELILFLGKELKQAYSNLVAIRLLKGMNGSHSVDMLRKHLEDVNEETLSLIFYALWIYHADMRLMYQALKSETASIAVEMVETTIPKELSPYLIPLIEDIPLDEKIEKGKKLFPIIRNDTSDRILTFLVEAEDAVTRMLALFVIGDDRPSSHFIPVVESRMHDASSHVREIAEYAFQRCMNEVAPMPDVIERINRLKTFTIFEGMGVRELHAIASVMSVELFSPGDLLIREGEENSSIYLIVGGRIAIYKNYGTDEQEQKVVLGEGAFLGELSLFTRMAPNATCVAAEPTEAYVLRHHQFQEIMRFYPQIGINLCRFFTTKLRQMSY